MPPQRASMSSPSRIDPQARIHIAFTVPEAALLYAVTLMTYEGQGRGTRVTAAKAGPDVESVLDQVTCKLYTGLRDTCGHGL